MHPVVRAFIWNPEGKILMIRHKVNTPWILPGGHVNNGEALHDAIKREILEEFGIQAKFYNIDKNETLSHKGQILHMNPLPIVSYDLSYKDSAGTDKSRTEYIFLMKTSDTIHHTQVEEIAEYTWMDPKQILSMTPNIDTWDFTIQILKNIIGKKTLRK